MCTVSWVRDDGGYHLLCNRDEKRTRGEAMAPRVRSQHGVQVIVPADSDCGGAWIGANECGVSLCLLNGANLGVTRDRQTTVVPAAVSRGLLLLEVAGAESAEVVCEHLLRADLTRVAPFTLVALEPDMPAAVIEWDGHEKAILLNADALMPLTSSSFEPDAVRERRQRQFANLVRRRGKLDPALLYEFHESHGSGANAFSTCMHRPDAQTVSFSWVTVTASEVQFFYSPAAPCQFQPGETQTLALRQ